MSREPGLFEAYGAAVGGPDSQASDRMEQAIATRLERQSAQRVTRLRWAVASSVLAAAAAFLLLFMTWDRDPGPVDPSRASGAVVVATTDRGQTVELPLDGRVELAAHTQIRLEADEASGASVELLDGEVELDVNSGPGLRWRVMSDGYEVLAVGTRYRVRKTGGVPVVVVEEGVVRLSGPKLPPDGVLIHAGSLDGDRDKEKAAARALRDDAAAGLRSTQAPAAGVVASPEVMGELGSETLGQSGEASEAARPSAKEVASANAWVSRFHDAIQAGDDALAVKSLPRRFPTGRESLTPADYVDAGDALREVGLPDRAEKAYEAACHRKPKSGACGVATFRRAILRAAAGDHAGAIEQANHYLDAHPKGTLARDALGRRMEWQRARGQNAAAREDARAYLDRWPRGSRAELARSILQQ